MPLLFFPEKKQVILLWVFQFLLFVLDAIWVDNFFCFDDILNPLKKSTSEVGCTHINLSFKEQGHVWFTLISNNKSRVFISIFLANFSESWSYLLSRPMSGLVHSMTL